MSRYFSAISRSRATFLSILCCSVRSTTLTSAIEDFPASGRRTLIRQGNSSPEIFFKTVSLCSELSPNHRAAHSSANTSSDLSENVRAYFVIISSFDEAPKSLHVVSFTSRIIMLPIKSAVFSGWDRRKSFSSLLSFIPFPRENSSSRISPTSSSVRETAERLKML